MAVVALAISNVVAWRALNAERALRVAAEQRVTRPEVASQSLQLNPAWIRLQPLNVGVNRSVPVMAHQAAVATPGVATDFNSPAFKSRIAQQLADPKAREALRDQQKGMALQLYGDLLKRWHASGPNAERLLDALADYQLTEMVASLEGGTAGNSSTSRNAADDATLQALLKPKELDELRAFDTTLADRATLSSWLSELELAQTPLPADKAEQMVKIMHDEREALPPPQAPTSASDSASYTSALADWQTAYDERVRDGAALLLTNDQLARFEAFQRGQRAASNLFTAVPMTDSAPSPINSPPPAPTP